MGVEEKKKKSKTEGEKSKSADKPKKERSDKDKKEKKEKSDKPKDDKKKSSTGDKLLDRKIGLDKKNAAQTVDRPPPRQPRGPPPPSRPATDSYLADYDLPPSESESDDEVERRKVDESEKVFMARVSLREVT